VGEAGLKSTIFKEILQRFREHGIEIPYPRRDIRMIATPETPVSSTGSMG
jgi:small-conductance mechanosensitive channel